MMLNSLILAVAIVAHEPGYYTSLANHIQRWLQDESVAARVVTPAQMAGTLANEKIAFLLGFASPTAGEMQTLRAFSKRGGKLVVFHSASPALAELIGVKPVGYAKAPYPGAWSRMVFGARQPDGLPPSILQTSTILQRAQPIAGRSRTIATWYDRAGRTGGEPAWIASSTGYWMTHVLLADGEDFLKAQLCAALVGSVEPARWSASVHRARESSRQAAWRSHAAKQVPRKGEIHAVWDHSGCGLHPGNWSATIRTLKAANVTDLFVNIAGAGFAHYPSSVLPRSATYEQEGDQMQACLAAARGTGIRVHAWILCFTGTRATADRLEIFRKRGWRLKARNGQLTEYLDPANAAVRSHLLSAIDELQRIYPALSGIHLDFIRYGDSAAKPKNAAANVTGFVTEARRHVARPRWLTTAVYGKYPNCVGSVGQDWKSWLDLKLVDYVVPMDYSSDTGVFTELLKQQASSAANARRTIVGIGVTANESRLDARQVIDQINLSRRYGFAGNALFDLDVTLEKRIFPYLSQAQWRQ